MLCGEAEANFQPMASRSSANRITILTSGEMQAEAPLRGARAEDVRSFPLESSWLSGEEYHHILSHVDAYCHFLGFKKYERKSHPLSIYTAPTSELASPRRARLFRARRERRLRLRVSPPRREKSF